MLDKNINKLVQELYLTNKYFVRRESKRSNFDYWKKIKVDPDGKKRNMLTERERLKFIQNNVTLIEKIKNLSGIKKIIDFGCGAGFLLSALEKKFHLFGIENNINAVDYAKQFAKVYQKDLNKSFDLNIKFDLVVIYHVIEHLNNPGTCMKNIRKHLKKNKFLLIGTPDFDSAMARFFGNNFRLLHDKTHISLFSVDSLSRFLRDNGFKILSIDFPYFETEYFTKKNLLKIFKKNDQSPPFYGNMFTILAKKL